jgi:hypothetical protein
LSVCAAAARCRPRFNHSVSSLSCDIAPVTTFEFIKFVYKRLGLRSQWGGRLSVKVPIASSNRSLASAFMSQPAAWVAGLSNEKRAICCAQSFRQPKPGCCGQTYVFSHTYNV